MHRLSRQLSELTEARSLVSSARATASVAAAAAAAAAFVVWVPLVAASQKKTKTGCVRIRKLIILHHTCSHVI